MISCRFCGKKHNVGFVSFRIAGTDGVTLELAKWADIFESEGFNCFYFAGELDRPEDVSYFSEMSHFKHPEILELYKVCFGKKTRLRKTSKRLQSGAYFVNNMMFTRGLRTMAQDTWTMAQHVPR